MDPGHLETWDDVLGNDSIKALLQNTLRALETGKQFRLNTLLLGDSRQGKTSILEFFLRCLHCRNLCPETLNPNCKPVCESCRNKHLRYGECDYYREKGAVYSCVIDCPNESPQFIQNMFEDVRDTSAIRVIVLDEFARLADRVAGQRLLRSLEEPGILWFATSISDKNFEPAILRRFNRLETEPPSLPQLTRWTCQRMNRQGIKADHNSTISTLIRAAGNSPGVIVEVLRTVEVKPDRTLTADDLKFVRAIA